MRRVERGILVGILCLIWAGAGVADEPETPAERAHAEWVQPIEDMVREAKDLGASKRCPRTYEAAVTALKAAEAAVLADPEGAGRGTAPALLASARVQALRVLGRIRTIESLRKRRHEWEETVILYDRLVESVASVQGIALAPELAGEAAGLALLDSLGLRRTERRAQLDSLIFANRDLTRWVDADRAARDTQLVRYENEITLLRHRLWEQELRAGMAEADAGQAHQRARREVERRDRVRALAELFTAEEGEILLTPEGDVRVRLAGLKFASGSAWLNPAYEPLLDKVSTVAQTFPGTAITVEGHTDDSGARQANLDLSRERARRVAAALAAKMEVAVDQIGVAGMGPDRPVAPNSSAAGRALNRRIEFLFETGAQDGGEAEEVELTPDPVADSP